MEAVDATATITEHSRRAPLVAANQAASGDQEAVMRTEVDTRAVMAMAHQLVAADSVTGTEAAMEQDSRSPTDTLASAHPTKSIHPHQVPPKLRWIKLLESF